MKKFTKGMLIAAGIFGAVGIGLTAAGGVMGASMSELTGVESLKRVLLVADGDYDYDDSDDYDDDYTSIVRSYGVSFVIDGKAYLTLGSTAGGSYYSNYWIYDPETDLWEGDDLTAFEGSTRIHAVCFSTGIRGIIATGGSGSSSYFDDTWELKPYEYEEE